MLMKPSKGIRIFVNKAMADADFNAKEAKLSLIEQAETDLALRSTLIVLGADQAIRDYFYDSRRKERNNAERDFYRSRELKNPDPVEIDERRKKKIERRLFWDRYALYGYTPLKIATRGDLEQSVENRQNQIKGNMACAKFEKDVAKELPNDKVSVGKSIKIEKILQLARKHDVIGSTTKEV